MIPFVSFRIVVESYKIQDEDDRNSRCVSVHEETISKSEVDDKICHEREERKRETPKKIELKLNIRSKRTR